MHLIKIANRLLKNELSATETYQQILNRSPNDGGMKEKAFLIPIYKGHKDAASSLQKHIRKLGGTPAEHSGVGDAWRKIVQGGANMLGKKSALKALWEGEKNRTEEYEKVLRNTQLPLSIRCLIEWKLLLVQKSHTRILDRLLYTATV
jgi:uncharacterized protein (TIGR02284 family)